MGSKYIYKETGMAYRLVIILSLIVGSLFGQHQDTVYETLFTNRGTAPQVAAISSSSSIGQAGHSFLAVFNSKPAHLCTSPDSIALIEGSYDNVTWNAFGSGDGLTPNFNKVVSIVGQGAYPRVRINILSFDTVNCNVSVYYSGSITQAPIVSVQGVGNLSFNANYTSPVYVGGKSSSAFPGYGPTIHGIIACDKFLNTSAVAAGTSMLVDVPFKSGFYICSISMSGSAAGVIASLSASTTAACAGPFTNLTPSYILGTGSVSLGSGLGQIVTSIPPGPTDGSVCLATAGAGTVYIMMSYAIF